MQAAPDAPIACTLPSADLPQRLAWIRQVTRRSRLAHRLDGSTLTLQYRLDARAELFERFLPLAPSRKDCGCAAGACG